MMFAGGLVLYAKRTGIPIEVRSGAVKACPMGAIDKIKWYNANGYSDLPSPEECRAAPGQWASDLAAWRPDMIVVVGGPMNASTLHRAGAPSDDWVVPTQPEGRKLVAAGVTTVARDLARAAPDVPQLWLTAPHVYRKDLLDGIRTEPGGPQTPAFIDVYNQVVATMTTKQPWATTVPWGQAFDAEPVSRDADERLDGVHIYPQYIDVVLSDWFPRLVDATNAVRAENSGDAATRARQ